MLQNPYWTQSVGAEACDSSPLSATCRLCVDVLRLCVAHVMSVKRGCVFHKIISLKPKDVLIAIDTILTPGVAKWQLLRMLCRASWGPCGMGGGIPDRLGMTLSVPRGEPCLFCVVRVWQMAGLLCRFVGVTVNHSAGARRGVIFPHLQTSSPCPFSVLFSLTAAPNPRHNPVQRGLC